MRTACGIVLLALFVAGCAKIPRPGAAESYERACQEALNMRQLDVAESNCQRALATAKGGTIALELKSQRLYDLAQVKRQLGKFQEAEELLNRSLDIEGKLSPTIPLRIARRQVELALALAGKGRWEEGGRILDQMLPVTDQFNFEMKTFTADVLERYADELRTSRPELSARFHMKAVEITAVRR